MRIITISREFGSGGRELGKRMADLLHFTYYDKEIVAAIAQKTNLDESYVSEIIEKGLHRNYPITTARTFAYPVFLQQNTTNILVAQQKIIKELAAQGDCIVMGQSADVILQEHQPFNVFVYADLSSKIKRCRERAPEDEHLTNSQLEKKIKQVDAGRSKRHELLTNEKWGAKEGYHLCINTTGMDIKSLAPQIVGYAEYRFGMEAL